MDAISCTKHFAPLKTFVFEPNPRGIQSCKANIERFEMQSKVELIPKAVSETDGMISFYPVIDSTHVDGSKTDNYGASSMYKASGMYGEEYVQECIEAESVTANTFLTQRSIQSVSLLLMDVQGAEVSVLKSFGESLRCVDYIITEGTIVNQYVGQAQLWQINDFLCANNFAMCAVDMQYWGLGDFLYINKRLPIPLISDKAN